MRTCVILALWAASAGLVPAIDPVPRETALRYAFHLCIDGANLRGTPIATDPDVKCPVAFTVDTRAVLLLPETRLDLASLAQVQAEPRPLGQLWLRQVVPLAAGRAIPGDSLQTVALALDAEILTLRRCALACARRSDGGLELLIYGTTTDPVLRVPLAESQDGRETRDQPLSATVEEADGGGVLRLTVLGRYVAEVALGDG